ncbi:MAG: aminoacyl-tRNA hydrolase [Acidimicrobiia bacterium]|nr:aminoacyl-tRNA hydrolase [Acidimicrobiia bacterium]
MQLPLTAPIRVAEHLTVPGDELRWRFDTSGGPGGQHANRSSTRVELSWDLGSTAAVTEPTRRRLLERLGKKAPGGIVTVIAADTRSQWRNRSIARHRMHEVLTEALREDPDRVPTRVPHAARRRRLEGKRRRADLKRSRRMPEQDE